MQSPAPVLVEMDGGAAGSDGTAATWTYSIFPLYDTSRLNAIATGVEVISRLIPVAYDEAPEGSVALALKVAGTWKIVSGTIAETVASATICGGA